MGVTVFCKEMTAVILQCTVSVSKSQGQNDRVEVARLSDGAWIVWDHKRLGVGKLVAHERNDPFALK